MIWIPRDRDDFIGLLVAVAIVVGIRIFIQWAFGL